MFRAVESREKSERALTCLLFFTSVARVVALLCECSLFLLVFTPIVSTDLRLTIYYDLQQVQDRNVLKKRVPLDYVKGTYYLP